MMLNIIWQIAMKPEKGRKQFRDSRPSKLIVQPQEIRIRRPVKRNCEKRLKTLFRRLKTKEPIPFELYMSK